MPKQFFQMLSGVLILLFVLPEYADAQNSSEMTAQNQATTVELTSFRLVEGADETAFVEVAAKMQELFLNRQEGFIKRTLVRGEDGWTDVVYWKDAQSMQKAMQKAESSMEVAPFMQMIDFNSVKMNLSAIKLNVN